jgi:hypothetical protein
MNAGAHTSCVADRLVRVLVLNPDGQLETLSKEDLNYSYRSSSLQGDQRLVIEATFQLEATDNREEIMTITTHNLRHRKSTQPYDRPSCGSVFRNPKPQYAGALIEEMGIICYQIGVAQVSELHANFILNIGSSKVTNVKAYLWDGSTGTGLTGGTTGTIAMCAFFPPQFTPIELNGSVVIAPGQYIRISLEGTAATTACMTVSGYLTTKETL